MSDNDSDADMVVVPLRVSNSMKENGTFLHVQVRVQIAVFSVCRGGLLFVRARTSYLDVIIHDDPPVSMTPKSCLFGRV